ncbi:MAG: hypothetical protein ACUVRY_08720 [Thermoanaerobaculaceae bacterium]
MVPATLLAATVFVMLCPLPRTDGCIDRPEVTGEIWADGELKNVAISWTLDGQVVAADTLPLLGSAPQTVALFFEGPHRGARLRLEVFAETAKGQDELVLPPPCGFWLRLADFTWDKSNVQADLVNLGSGTTGYIPVRWFVNGILLGEGAVGPLSPGGKVQVLLPAASHGLLFRALTKQPKRMPGEKRQVPVVVTLSAQPGPGDWEAPTREWSWHLGFVGATGRPKR